MIAILRSRDSDLPRHGSLFLTPLRAYLPPKLGRRPSLLEGCRMGSAFGTGSSIAVVLLLFGRGKISDLMGDVAQGIKSFKKGLQDDDKAPEKPAEPVKTIDHNGRRRQRRRGPMSAARLSEPGILNQASVEGRRLRKGAAAPNLAMMDWDADVSRERKNSCSTSGGVNWSSSRLSR